MPSQAPQILDRVAGLTSIRDANLLDVSMVRTLFELLRPERVGLFRLESSTCREGVLWGGAAGTTVDVLQREIQPGLLARARMAHGGRLRWAEPRDDTMVQCALFPVTEVRSSMTYLVVEHSDGDSLDDTRLIDAFLRFYANYCSLLDYSQRDQLTGLLNRKTFDDHILRLLSSGAGSLSDAEREDSAGTRRGHHDQSWLAMLDIDHFKRINDGFGHLYGDEVLLIVSQILRRSFRETDLLFRFGGEEFVVVLVGGHRDGAMAAFEKMRLSIAAHEFPQLGHVTLSGGVVELSRHHAATQLLDMADRALYFAKQNGRNQMALYEGLVEKGLIEESRTKIGEIELF